MTFKQAGIVQRLLDIVLVMERMRKQFQEGAAFFEKDLASLSGGDGD